MVLGPTPSESLRSLLEIQNHRPHTRTSEQKTLELGSRNMCFNTPSPSFLHTQVGQTLLWNPRPLCVILSWTQLHGFLITFSVPLLNRSFSAGIQKGKVWHLLGTSVTHGEISRVTNPGTMPSWKSRGLFFSCFLSLRREVLETQSKLKKCEPKHWFGFGFDYLKLGLQLNLVMTCWRG